MAFSRIEKLELTILEILKNIIVAISSDLCYCVLL